MPEQPLRTVTEVLEALGRIDQQHLRWSQKKSDAIRVWAMKQAGIDYAEGDTVAVCSDFADGLTPSSGWYRFREAMRRGALAEVRDIDFNTHTDDWHADVVFHRLWSVDERFGGRELTQRTWRSHPKDMPPGYVAYSDTQWPEGKPSLFSIRTRHLTRWIDTSAERAS